MSEATKPKFTPGPWRATRSIPEEGFDCWWISGNCAQNLDKEFATVAGGAANSEGNACLIAAAPLLLMIAEIAAHYTWASLGGYAPMTEGKKGDVLAAYRAYVGYRDGALTMEEAWNQVAPVAEGLRANGGVK